MEILTPKEGPRTRLAPLLLAALITAAASGARAQAPISKEYQVKAVFLYNFAQFVKWPSSSYSQASEPFRIGILGDDPFDGFLDEAVRGESVDGHPLVIERYNRPQDAKDCRILFISRSEIGRLEGSLAGLRDKRILTVGDMEGFLKDGGVIRFITEGNRIHFKVNLAAAKRVNLTISSKMLRLAEITGPGED